jgi:hypothetical protein
MEGVDWEVLAPSLTAIVMDMGRISVAIMDRFGALRGGSGK